MWFNRVKIAAMLSHAMPVAAIHCPQCETCLAVDVNQKINETQGSAYGSEGTVLTICPQCHAYVQLDWHEKSYALATATATNLDAEAAEQAIANGVPVVVNGKLTPEEFEFYSSEG